MSIFKEIIQEIHEQICHDVDGNCDECPRFISKRCEAEEAKAPKGWIKLENDMYINASKIVGVCLRSGGTVAATEIYTMGAEDNPWLVDESIDEIIKKLKRHRY